LFDIVSNYIFLQIIGVHFVLDTTELHFNKYLNLVCTTLTVSGTTFIRLKSKDRKDKQFKSPRSKKTKGHKNVITKVGNGPGAQ
jgi:hypothetical protein